MIIGIDPGFATIGYAFLASGNTPRVIDLGTITTDKKNNFFARLVEIEKNLEILLDLHQPKNGENCYAAVEKIFFMKNKKTAIEVAHARGVICKSLYQAGIEIHEYSPNEIKKAITGRGQATKEEIQAMVVKILNLKNPITQDDTADALAMSICHWFFLEKDLANRIT